MRWFILLTLVLISTAILPLFFNNKTAKRGPVASTVHKIDPVKDNTVELLRLKKFSRPIKTYAADHQYNTEYCFLVDMKQASGNNRFFVYDLKNDSVLQAGLVAHGYGGNSGNSIHFSNVVGSNCTSLGKYKIGHSYNGRFGLAYKLYGLDPTNSNAFNRFVVLHAHECVPDVAISSEGICMSQGCPTVSPSFLSSLRTWVDKSAQPVLLYIFY